jgi:hypothetical protein
VSVTSGTSRSFAITAASGYRISSVIVDGVSVGLVGSSVSYMFSNVIKTHTIQALFAKP